MTNFNSSVKTLLIIVLFAGCKKELVKDPVFTSYFTNLLGGHTCMHFINKSTGFIGSSGGSIIKTTNAGVNWNYLPSLKSYAKVTDIHFFNENSGFAVSNGLRKFDGSTWTLIPEVQNVAKLLFIDDKHGIAYSMSETMYVTSDGGNTWKKTQLPTSYTINAMGVSFHEEFGVATTTNELLYSKDFGATWEVIAKSRIYYNNSYSGSSSSWLNYSNVLVRKKSDIILINETITGFTNSHFNSIKETYNFNFESNMYQNETAFADMVPFGKHCIFIAGSSGYDFYSKNNGESWIKMEIDGKNSVEFQVVEDEIYSISDYTFRIGKIN